MYYMLPRALLEIQIILSDNLKSNRTLQNQIQFSRKLEDASQ